MKIYHYHANRQYVYRKRLSIFPFIPILMCALIENTAGAEERSQSSVSTPQTMDSGKSIQVANAITFQADTRKSVEEAYPGDIIGLHNHGTIQVGDTFTQGEILKYGGIPYFAPELFRRVILKDPLRAKALQKGLVQLTEEGATQLFKPLKNNDLILGAVGILQFDVTAFRLKSEYNVECVYDAVPISTVRWVSSDKPAKLEEFKKKAFDNLAEDGGGYLVYLANSRVNVQLTEERWPDIKFSATREL